MHRTLKNAAAIVGIYDLAPLRARADRNFESLLAEVCLGAIKDAGLRKADIDGLIMEPEFGTSAGGLNAKMADYLGLPNVTWGSGINVQGASGATAVAQAAAYINAGLANYVLVACASVRDPSVQAPPPIPSWDPFSTEFQFPFGPVVAANGWYAMVAARHEALYGTTVEKRAKIAVDQRTNANHNPLAVFHGTPLTAEDVINSRIISDPLHLLECVMPCSGGSAYILGRADRATSLRRPPVYILGGAVGIPRSQLTHVSEFTVAPIQAAAYKAFAQAGYGPRDMDVLELYDSYTITVICELESSGFCPIGEGGDWIQDQDFTFRGNLPLNTHGGQMSFGQAGDAGGFSQVTEAVRQLRGQAGDRQVRDPHLAYVSGSGGVYAQQAAIIMSNDITY